MVAHRPALTLLAAAAVVVAAVGVARCDQGGTSAPVLSDRSPPAVSSPLLLTDSLLQRQSRAVSARDVAGYLAGWAAAPATRRQATATYRNITALGITRFEPVVDEGTVSGGGPTWTAAVDVTWMLSGVDRTETTSAVLYTFAERHGRAVVVRVNPVASRREPVWLLPDLTVRRSARTLVAGTDPAEATRVDTLLQSAVDAVGRVLPGWHGDLVAYVPASAAEFDALIDAAPGQYRKIAAVTTTVDGSHDVTAPTAIVVNPQVFAALGPIGAQVVLTHEATHAATHAAAVDMPLWVAEGFADYVAIRSVDVPVETAARAALRLVRRAGAPAALPADSAFAVGGARLEATYEMAWLAASLIARTYGQSRLVAFYRMVEAHPEEPSAAFETVLHTSGARFTRAWRGYLIGLVRAG